MLLLNKIILLFLALIYRPKKANEATKEEKNVGKGNCSGDEVAHSYPGSPKIGV